MDDSLAIRSGEDAGSSAASPEAAQAHLQHAIRSLRQSQLEQAIFHARSSVRFAHSSWSSLEDLGLVLFRLGELFPLSFGVLLQASRNGQLKERGFELYPHYSKVEVNMISLGSALRRWPCWPQLPVRSASSLNVRMCFVFDQLSKVYLGLNKIHKLDCAPLCLSGGHTSLKNRC